MSAAGVICDILWDWPHVGCLAQRHWRCESTSALACEAYSKHLFVPMAHILYFAVLNQSPACSALNYTPFTRSSKHRAGSSSY